MFAIKRNQVIVTTLMVMIAVAGYLNFTGSSVGESGDKTTLSSQNEEAVLKNDEISVIADDVTYEDMDIALDPITAEVTADASAAEEEGEDDIGAAVFVNAVTTDSDTYFVEAKLDREQARAKEKDILSDMIDNKNVSEQKKAECADAILKLQKRIESETAAESMIKAKGFKEAYVRIDDNTVDVVVDRESLTESETAQILDIVKRKTGFEENKIRISLLKSAK